MKRKATALDENPSWDSWSPLSNSSTSSYRSLDEKAVATLPWTFTSTRNHVNDHLNFRTKKRLRDNRPDLEAVHQNTLAKLFGAQRQHPTTVLDEHPRFTHSVHEYDPIQSSLGSTEPAQRSLHSFFNIGQCQAPAKQSPASVQQRADVASSACEDCGNDLNQAASHQNLDTQMMDVGQMQQPLLDEDYECAVCSRNICDMCAVRGDRRICLECAMPGSG